MLGINLCQNYCTFTHRYFSIYKYATMRESAVFFVRIRTAHFQGCKILNQGAILCLFIQHVNVCMLSWRKKDSV